MEIAKFEGRVSYVDYHATYQLVGSSGDLDSPEYNSITYLTALDEYIPCMFGSKYYLTLTDGTGDYVISKVDGMNVDSGYVAYTLSSVASNNVTNTSTKQLTFIIKNNNKLVEKLQIGASVGVVLKVEETRK